MSKKKPMVFFRNYDYVDTGGDSPGTGLYSGKYKSVMEFRQKKRNKNMKKRERAIKDLVRNASDDQNELTDHYEMTTTPIPWNPPEIAPFGLFDGIYPQEDLEDKPIWGPMFYGILESQPLDLNVFDMRGVPEREYKPEEESEEEKPE